MGMSSTYAAIPENKIGLVASTNLATGLINGEVLSSASIAEIGKNRTGHLKSDGTNYVQHLGYLCYSKYPKQSDSEVWLGLSGQTFASPGWLGNQLTVDPVNGYIPLWLLIVRIIVLHMLTQALDQKLKLKKMTKL